MNIVTEITVIVLNFESFACFQSYKPDYNATYFDIDDSRFSDENIHRPTITLESNASVQHIVIHNSMPRSRESVVEFLVSSPLVKVETLSGTPVLSQITPLWSWNNINGTFVPEPSTKQYRLLFKASVPPLGLTTYVLRSIKSAQESTYVCSLLFQFHKSILFIKYFYPFSQQPHNLCWYSDLHER